MKKRVLIRGTGALGETRVDHRGNAPAFRIANASVLLNLDIDMTGYTEALKFEGTDPAGALVHECIIRYVKHDFLLLQVLQSCCVPGFPLQRLHLQKHQACLEKP